MRPLKVALSAVPFTLALAASSAQTRAPQNRPPAVNMAVSTNRVVLAAGCDAPLACTPTAGTVRIIAGATDPDGDTLLYTYSTTGGRVTGDGPNATLDLTGVAPGTYAVTVVVSDRKGGTASDAKTIELARCTCPLPDLLLPPPCPTVDVVCPSELATPGKPLKFTASVSGGDPSVTPTFNWTTSAGVISGGQGTSEMTVDTSGLPRYPTVTATLDVGGYDRACRTSESCTVMSERPLVARKVDEFGVIALGDEKARLNRVREEMRNDPTAQMYLICYGGRRSRAGEAERRCYRAREYLVPTRGIDASRVVTVDGGLREVPTTEFWLIPSGAEPPRASPTMKTRAVAPAVPPRGARLRRVRP